MYVPHRCQQRIFAIFTLTGNSGSFQNFDTSCTARIFSLYDFQTILNANLLRLYALNIHFRHTLKGTGSTKITFPRVPETVTIPATSLDAGGAAES